MLCEQGEYQTLYYCLLVAYGPDQYRYRSSMDQYQTPQQQEDNFSYLIMLALDPLSPCCTSLRAPLLPSLSPRRLLLSDPSLLHQADAVDNSTI
eukprot:642725-Rhodomonas_salina.6